MPKVFVSSTCYDLKYIREYLKSFIHSIGYESVLSEDGDVYYDVNSHTHDACIFEISACQIFVLIIGGRFGGKYIDSEKSITNMEYEKAIELGIPVFTLVEQSVYSEHHVYTSNVKKNEPIIQKMHFPSVDSTKIFDFINQVRLNSKNNAIFSFQNYGDIELYLKKQWAGMMHQFLTRESESKKVMDLFEQMQTVTDKIEFYTRHMVTTMGEEKNRSIIKLYDRMVQSEIIGDLRKWKFSTTPLLVYNNVELDDLCNNQIQSQEEVEDANTLIYGGPPYKCSEKRYKTMSKQYSTLRDEIIQIMKEENLTESDLSEYSV